MVITLSANTTTTLTIVATDGAGNQSTATRYVYYDSAVPSLTVSAPAGTSSTNPTYYQSDSTVSYTVSGTVSDASGIKSVTINGSVANISGNNWSKSLSLATNTTHTITVIATDNADRTTTITRYIRVTPKISLSTSLASFGGNGAAQMFDAINSNAVSKATKAGDISIAVNAITIGRACTLTIKMVDKFQTNPGGTIGFSVYKNGSYYNKKTESVPDAYRTEITYTYTGTFAAGDVLRIYYTMEGSTKRDYEIQSASLTITES